MLMVVVTLFALCWLPLHVFNIILDFVPQLRNEDAPEASSIVVAVYTTAHWLAMSNSFVNPIVYGFLNDSFRVTNGPPVNSYSLPPLVGGIAQIESYPIDFIKPS